MFHKTNTDDNIIGMIVIGPLMLLHVHVRCGKDQLNSSQVSLLYVNGFTFREGNLPFSVFSPFSVGINSQTGELASPEQLLPKLRFDELLVGLCHLQKNQARPPII